MQKSPVSTVPMELARHEHAQTKPGLLKTKRKHEEIVWADDFQ